VPFIEVINWKLIGPSKGKEVETALSVSPTYRDSCGIRHWGYQSSTGASQLPALSHGENSHYNVEIHFDTAHVTDWCEHAITHTEKPEAN
jgi:hypothetical protein